MHHRGWKATFIILGIGIFFNLWGALNLWTGVVFNWMGHSEWASSDAPGHEFVTRGAYPKEFWLMVSFKFVAGTLLLIILGNAHWKRWRRRAEQKKLAARSGSA